MMRTRYELYNVRLGVNGERRFWCAVATSNCAFPNVAAAAASSSMMMIIISDSARETLVAWRCCCRILKVIVNVVTLFLGLFDS